MVIGSKPENTPQRQGSNFTPILLILGQKKRRGKPKSRRAKSESEREVRRISVSRCVTQVITMQQFCAESLKLRLDWYVCMYSSNVFALTSTHRWSRWPTVTNDMTGFWHENQWPVGCRPTTDAITFRLMCHWFQQGPANFKNEFLCVPYHVFPSGGRRRGDDTGYVLILLLPQGYPLL